MTSPPSLLFRGLFERSEFDGVSVGTLASAARASWGTPDASEPAASGSLFHRWGGIQLTEDRNGFATQLVVVCMPDLPPCWQHPLGIYRCAQSLRQSDLPPDAVRVPTLCDGEQSGYELGRVQYVFEQPSSLLVKLVISHPVSQKQARS